MSYEDRVKIVLENLKKIDWEEESQLQLSEKDIDFVEEIERDGYIKVLGGKPTRFKGGAVITGEVIITEKGKRLLEGK